MGLFKKSGTPAPTANYSTNFKLISGIAGWAGNFFVIKAELCPDKITFYQSPIGNAKTVSLSPMNKLQVQMYILKLKYLRNQKVLLLAQLLVLPCLAL